MEAARSLLQPDSQAVVAQQVLKAEALVMSNHNIVEVLVARGETAFSSFSKYITQSLIELVNTMFSMSVNDERARLNQGNHWRKENLENKMASEALE